jgi:hypothetical protein
MDDATRRAIEQRAYALWEQAGRPDGSALTFWLQAELELGIIPAVAPDDPFVTLQELAEEAREADERAAADDLQHNVDAIVPARERLPDPAGENPVSHKVAQAASNGARRKV